MYFNMNGTNKGVDYGLVTLEIQGPPLMPPGLNSNGRTLPGRHGVAAPPPGSQMFAHMRSLNNTTLAVWVLTAGPMASLGRDQMAPSPVCQVGFVVATREMPHGRRIGGRCGRKRSVGRACCQQGREWTNTQSSYLCYYRHSFSSSILWHNVDTFCTLNMPLMQNYQHYINQKRSLMPTQHHLHV